MKVVEQKATTAESLVEAQKFEIEYLKATVAYLQNKKYDKSKDTVDKSQYPDLFNYDTFDEAEANANSTVTDPEDITEETIDVSFKAKGKKKQNLINRFDNIEKKRIIHDIPESEKICGECGEKLSPIGSTITKKIKYVPAKLYIEEHEYLTYKCVKCSENSDKDKINKAPYDLAFPKSMADSSLVSHIIIEKYMKSVPLYRQEKMFKQYGIPLTRINMSNWIMSAAGYIKPIFDQMHKDILKHDIVMMDETTLNVLESENETNYVWMMNSSKYDKQIYLYFYKETREHHHAQDILEGFEGKYIQSDAWGAYSKIKGTINVNCLAHARRKFVDIHKISKNKKETYKHTNNYCGKAIEYYDKLYRIERKLTEKNATIEEIYKERQEKAIPILKEFKAWLDEAIKIFPEKSKMGEALAYSQNNFDKMSNYCLDGRLAIDNNKSERQAKSWVIGRKNWLFSVSETGANASAMMYSIVETAKCNNLMVANYLEYVFNTMAKYEKPSTEVINSLLPYSESIIDKFKIK